MKQTRGALTRRVADMSKKTLGYEITLTELRLMPYIQYRAMNERTISWPQVNDDETSVLRQWEDKGFLKIDTNTARNPRFTLTKKFYDALSEILYLAYVDITED